MNWNHVFLVPPTYNGVVAITTPLYTALNHLPTTSDQVPYSSMRLMLKV
jgi:hypothetical protein